MTHGHRTADKAPVRRRWFQYSLRTLLLAMTVFAVWLAVQVNRVRRLERTIARIEQLGGSVLFDYQQSNADADPPAPRWLRAVVGEGFFRSVVRVNLRAKGADDALLKQIGVMCELESLDVCSGHVTDAGLRQLRGLTKLKALDVSFNNVTDDGLRHLRHLDELLTLRLDVTGVTDEGVASLKPLTRLYTLSLYGTQTTDEGLRHLAQMPSLGSLDLGNTHVTDAGLAHLIDLPQLTRLRLDRMIVRDTDPVRISDVGLAHLARMRNLTSLGLANHHYTDRGLADLQRALPRLRIE